MYESRGEIAQPASQRLSKIEKYQAFKPERGTSKDIVMALSWRIATEPKLYRELIPNPYAATALQVLSERFPETASADVIRAVVLAEPEGIYDRNFRQLPREQQRDELYRQIDSSAEMTMRLAKYFNEHTQEFRELPRDQIYERLTNSAFGTSDLREVEERYARSQRRGFRLSVINFIEDLQKLKPYKDEFTTDPKATAAKIFEKELEGSIEVESLPVGFVIYLDEVDYGKFESMSDEGKEYFSSSGITLFWSSLPPELRGRIVVINKGGDKRGVKTPKQIRDTREHEVRHILFSSFLAEGELVHLRDTDKTLSELYYFEDHKEYADQLRKNFLHDAKDEVIAYYASGDVAYRELGDLDGDQWLEHLEKVRNHLWIQEDLGPEEKALIYDQYHARFVSYLQQIREYQWVAQKLFQIAREQQGDTLTVEKAEALLQNTSVDKAKRLARYFGVNPEDVPQLQQQEQQQLVKDFSKTVDELTRPQRGKQTEVEEWLSWAEKVGWNKMDRIKFTYPVEATPAFLRVIEGANNEFFVEDSIYAVELILQMNQQRFSTQDLTKIRTSLEKMLGKRISDDFASARKKAEELMRTIDEVYMYGGVDFIHHKPFGVDVAQIMKTEEGQEPSITQIIQLVDLLLSSKNVEIWWKYFEVDYLNILAKQPDGVSALVKMGKIITNPYFVGATIQNIDENFDALIPDARIEIGTMLSHVLSFSYEAPPNILEELKKDANKLKDRLEGRTVNQE